MNGDIYSLLESLVRSRPHSGSNCTRMATDLMIQRRVAETYGLLIEAIYELKDERPESHRWFTCGANGESMYERREKLYGLALVIESWVSMNIDEEDRNADIRAEGLGAWDGDVIPAIWGRICSQARPATYNTWAETALDYLKEKTQ